MKTDKTKIAVGVFDKLAAEYQKKFMDVSLYGNTFDLFCEHLRKDAEVLELACGPGNITKYLLNKRPDLKLLGTDLAPNMIRLAAENNPEAEFKILDSRNISILEKKYDGIMCGFCLPYLSKEEALKLIDDASALLKQNGILYLSTMEDEYTLSGFKKGSTGDEIFMHYHQADYLKESIDKNKLHVLLLDRKLYSGPKNTTITDLIIIAQK